MLAARRLATGLASLASLMLTACWHTVGRIPFQDEGEKTAVVKLDPGDVRFGTEVEARYHGEAIAHYDIQFSRQNRLVAKADCDPLRMTGARSCMYRFNHKDYVCSFVMDCRTHVDTGGPTFVRVRFSIPTKPPGFKLERADLVIGQ